VQVPSRLQGCVTEIVPQAHSLGDAGVLDGYALHLCSKNTASLMYDLIRALVCLASCTATLQGVLYSKPGCCHVLHHLRHSLLHIRSYSAFTRTDHAKLSLFYREAQLALWSQYAAALKATAINNALHSKLGRKPASSQLAAALSLPSSAAVARLLAEGKVSLVKFAVSETSCAILSTHKAQTRVRCNLCAVYLAVEA